MAWIESHQELGRHPTLLRLASRLRIHRAQAIGHLQYLWWWALDFAPSGSVSALTSAEITAASEWPGPDPDAFVNALKETGWIDGDGNMRDHDDKLWKKTIGVFLKVREQNRKRQRRLRRKTVTRDTSVSHVATNTNTKPIPNQTLKSKPLNFQTEATKAESKALIFKGGKSNGNTPELNPSAQGLLDRVLAFTSDFKSRNHYAREIARIGSGLVELELGVLADRVRILGEPKSRGAYLKKLLKKQGAPDA